MARTELDRLIKSAEAYSVGEGAGGPSSIYSEYPRAGTFRELADAYRVFPFSNSPAMESAISALGRSFDLAKSYSRNNFIMAVTGLSRAHGISRSFADVAKRVPEFNGLGDTSFKMDRRGIEGKYYPDVEHRQWEASNGHRVDWQSPFMGQASK